MGNYCERCGAFRVGNGAMEEHLRTGHDPAEKTTGNGLFFDRNGYMPGSATEEFGGDDQP